MLPDPQNTGEPQFGDLYLTCVHDPMLAGRRVWWWGRGSRWAGLCNHCFSLSSLGREIKIMPEWRRLSSVPSYVAPN
jgi:hypothetical protein